MAFLMNNGDGATPCKLADLFDANEFTPEERLAVAYDIEVQGFHSGGGGAAGAWIIGTEPGLRVAMGFEVLRILGDVLTHNEWQACASGAAEPANFCDPNEATAEAFGDVFGCDFMIGEEIPALAAQQAANLARANGALRLASVLIRGEAVSNATALALVRDDDTRGLGQVVTRYTLPEMLAAIAAVWS